MLSSEKFISNLKKKINFFTGVPDSTLKSITHPLQKLSKKKHIIATNEGSAVSLAIGYYLTKKKIAAVYLQNSGLGNAINPLVSIANSNVYSIPMLLVIGWRGSPNSNDEPQHIEQGKITLNLLKLLKIKTLIIKRDSDLKKITKIINFSKSKKIPVACLIERNGLKSKRKITIENNKNFLLRSYTISNILDKIKKNTKIISTTGYTSRELYQIRKQYKYKKGKDFYMVGGMGHSSMVSLGVALHSKKEVLCLDGDGSLLMHLGGMGIAGNFGTKNFKHVLFNNGSHESVGGQPTIANKINFKKLSLSLGYKRYFKSDNKLNFSKELNKFLKSNGPSFFEIKIRNEKIKNLARPKELKSVKSNFIK
jgi:phosphonopyruvate decarboxylase